MSLLWQMARFHSYVYEYISHLLYPFVLDKHLGWFHILGVINNDNKHQTACIFFKLVILFSSDKYLEVHLLDLMVVLYLIFLGTSTVFSIGAAPIYTPRIVHEGSLFSTSSAILVICCLFDDSHSDRCEVVFHCGFDFHFPDDQSY